MTQFTFEVPIGDLTFIDKDKTKHVYAPQDDITPIELAHLLHLMIICVNARAPLTWQPFVEKHNLWRHFRAGK